MNGFNAHLTIQPTHRLKIALLQPQIAPNTGNIGRTCVATAAPLHLVRPLGFVLSDAQLRRSGMDFWPRVDLTIHDDTAAFLNHLSDRRAWFFSSRGQRGLWEVSFAADDWLVFGSETEGISPAILDARPQSVVRIPQVAGERCLNLSTAAGIALYEALRQVTPRAGVAIDRHHR